MFSIANKLLSETVFFFGSVILNFGIKKMVFYRYNLRHNYTIILFKWYNGRLNSGLLIGWSGGEMPGPDDQHVRGDLTDCRRARHPFSAQAEPSQSEDKGNFSNCPEVSSGRGGAWRGEQARFGLHYDVRAVRCIDQRAVK